MNAILGFCFLVLWVGWDMFIPFFCLLSFSAFGYLKIVIADWLGYLLDKEIFDLKSIFLRAWCSGFFSLLMQCLVF